MFHVAIISLILKYFRLKIIIMYLFCFKPHWFFKKKIFLQNKFRTKLLILKLKWFSFFLLIFLKAEIIFPIYVRIYKKDMLAIEVKTIKNLTISYVKSNLH